MPISTTSVLFSVFLIACSVSASDLRIAIDEQGVSVNGRRLKSPPSYAVLETIMGEPSRVHQWSQKEAERIEREEGFAPQTVYIYDQYGVTLHQNHESEHIQSISIPFNIETLSFPPKKPFSGRLNVSGVAVSANTSITQIKRIPNLKVNDSVVFHHTAQCGITRIGLDFTEDKTSLTQVLITLKPTPADGWTIELKTAMTVQIAKEPKMQDIAKKLNRSVDDIAAAIVDRLSKRVTIDEMFSRPEVIVEEMVRAIEASKGQAGSGSD